jgi:Domain of unknown function (DUF3303)
MRTLMTVQMETEAANHAIQDGSLAKTMEAALEQLHAEAAYFTTREGQRTAYIVFDLHDTTQIPEVAEPFFMGLNAKIDMAPVMNADDVQEGLARLPHR